MIIDGKKVAQKIQENLLEKIAKLTEKPGLAFVLVGENPASQAYVRMKQKACKEIGISSYVKAFSEKVDEKTLLSEIDILNRDPLIHGILVQQPLPSHIQSEHIINAVFPQKDVDGFHPINLGKLLTGQTDGFVPCTPLGIQALIEHYQIPIETKHVVIVGRSNIVGKPLAALLVQKKKGANATVTIAHSQTQDLPSICKQADILIAAIGKPKLITKDMVKKNSVVIDVGISRVASSTHTVKLIGDVDFEAVSKVASAITPVPKGVGPMTIAMLMQNTYMGYLKQREK